jgi:hypothetical protein
VGVKKLTYSEKRQKISDLPANQIWRKWNYNHDDGSGGRVRYEINVADAAKYGYRRQRFETWLFENNCYLEVKSGIPEIKSFEGSEEYLTLILMQI